VKRNLHAGKRSSGGFSLSVFTDDELNDLHLATLEVLETVGIFVEHDEALQRFGDAGAVIDRGKKVVKLPPYMVEDAIRSAPSKFVMAGRDPQMDFVVESNRVGFTTFGEAIQVVDPYTGELREPTKADVGRTAQVCDYLSEIDVYNRAVGAHDVPQDVAPLHNSEAFFANTTKHCMVGPFSGYVTRKIVEMAAEIVGGMDQFRARPLVTFHTCPVSPLKLVRDTCEILMESAHLGAPVNVISMAMAGGSSPVNLAGTIVEHNAEVLAALALNQLTCRGAKFIYASSSTALDLRFGAASVGSPECAMINAAVAKLAQYYLLPCFVAGG
jgi:trimethylamine--corrinoid protein Co-methyltransferase